MCYNTYNPLFQGVTTVADHGIIEYIEMHQFMCHKFLTFTFGPQINFIIGMSTSSRYLSLIEIKMALQAITEVYIDLSPSLRI